jgi:hypothetical protein
LYEGIVDDFEGLPGFVAFFGVFFLLVRSLIIPFSGVGWGLVQVFIPNKNFLWLHFKK